MKNDGEHVPFRHPEGINSGFRRKKYKISPFEEALLVEFLELIVSLSGIEISHFLLVFAKNRVLLPVFE